MARDEFVEPRVGPKLLSVYNAQDTAGIQEQYSIQHLENYIKYATLSPIPQEVLQKGRHRQDLDAGQDDCTSCHFCRQCTEDRKPRCNTCHKCFCGPCLANRFGQNAAEMVHQRGWTCPVCLDFCNCSGANCRRAQLGLEPTASLIHEAQAYGYSSVAEYLLITALFREGSAAEAQRALEWLTHPNRRFSARAFIQSTATTGVRNVRQRDRPEASGQSGSAPSDSLKRKRTFTTEERMALQLQHLTNSLGFLTMKALHTQVQYLQSETQLLPSVSMPARQPGASRQTRDSHPLAALQQAAGSVHAAGERRCVLDAGAVPAGLTSGGHPAIVQQVGTTKQPDSREYNPFPRSITGVVQASFHGTSRQPLQMMRSSQVGSNAQPHGSLHQPVQPQRLDGRSLTGQCIGAPVSAEATELWNRLEGVEEAQLFQQRSRARSGWSRAPPAARASALTPPGSLPDLQPGVMQDESAGHESLVHHSTAHTQQNAGAASGHPSARLSGVSRGSHDGELLTAGPGMGRAAIHAVPRADTSDLHHPLQQQADAQSEGASVQQGPEPTILCTAEHTHAVLVESAGQGENHVDLTPLHAIGPGGPAASAEQHAADGPQPHVSHTLDSGAWKDTEPEGVPYVTGAVHSDATCAILVDGLVRRTHELAVRGLTLQQLTRIDDHIRDHQEAMVGHSQEYVVDEEGPPSNEVTWKRHGAELLVARSVMGSIKEACTLAQSKGDFAAGAAVDRFSAALFQQGEHVEMCNILQDRVNAMLTVGHAAVLGACGQGARVQLVPERGQSSQDNRTPSADRHLTHVELDATLRVFKCHITSFWPCKRRSSLDARVLKRLTDTTWNKWVMQEREMTWRAIALGSRGLRAWGAVLYSQLTGLLVERAPGLSLMMLKAKGGALQKVNEEACSLLLGNLVMHAHKSLQQIIMQLSALLSTPESVQPNAEVLCSACSVLLSVFPVSTSEASFWTDIMKPQNMVRGQPGTFLMSLTYTVLSEAYSILPQVLQLIPPGRTQASKFLDSCAKQLNQSLGAGEAMLATWQRFCSIGDSEQLSGEAHAAFTHSCLMLASAISSLHQCGRCCLLKAVAPFRINADAPSTSLPVCVSTLPDAGATGLRLVLSELAKTTPNSLLDISLPNTLLGASTPTQWSIRWCLLAGSFCDLLLGHSTTSAVFWPSLVSASQTCAEELDMWGGERHLNIQTLQTFQRDASGALWGQWLSCAMLSGMLPAELSHSPALASEVLLRAWAAPTPQAARYLTLNAACALVEHNAACTVHSSLRVAVASVVALTAATAANQMNPAAITQLVPVHREHAQLLLTMWSACVLKSARLIVGHAWSPSEHSAQENEASTTLADAAQSQIRSEVRASVLCGGHVQDSCASLQTFLQLLAGSAVPSELLCIPPALMSPQLRAPDLPHVTVRSWQGQLLTGLISRLLYTLSYASQPLVAQLGEPGILGSGGMEEDGPQELRQQRSAVASHVILQELAGASSGFADLSNVEKWVNGTGQSMHLPDSGSDIFLPILIGLHNTVCGAEAGGAIVVQTACNALLLSRCIANSQKLRGGLGYALMLRVLLLPVLQTVSRASKTESHAAIGFELVSLVQSSLPAAELLPPVASGSLHPGPHHSVPAHAALGWYALQQAIICSLQALHDLLCLPPSVAGFVQQQMAAIQSPLAITAVEPGHCLWQVRKASATLPAVAIDPPAGSGSASLLEWATVASLLVNKGGLEGILWALLRNGRSGVQWVMHTLPRLGWLVVAAEACYCNGAMLMHGGPPLLSQRAALSVWLQKQIPWVRGRFQDLLETLHLLHNQDVSFHEAQKIPDGVITEAVASLPPAAQARALPPIAPAAPHPPPAPAARPPPPPSLCTTVPYSAVLSQYVAGSSANCNRASKLTQRAPWAQRPNMLDETSLVHGSVPVGTAHAVQCAAAAGEVSSASAPGISIAQGSYVVKDEGEGEVEHVVASMHLPSAGQPESANVATQPMGTSQALPATQPYSAAMTQPHSSVKKDNSQVLAGVRRAAALLRQGLAVTGGSRGHDEGTDEVDSAFHP